MMRVLFEVWLFIVGGLVGSTLTLHRFTRKFNAVKADLERLTGVPVEIRADQVAVNVMARTKRLVEERLASGRPVLDGDAIDLKYEPRPPIRSRHSGRFDA